MFSCRTLLEATIITKETNSKTKIIEAVKRILTEGDRPVDLTVRQIADQAGVGIGTINYHFQSKDRLIYEAVSSMLISMAGSLTVNEAIPKRNPYEKLRDFFVGTSDLLINHFDIYKLQIQYELILGNMNTSSFLLPLLDKIFGGRKGESEIKLMSLQLVTTMQVIFLHSDAFKSYSGIDILDKKQRDAAIDIMLSNIITKKGEGD